MEKKKWLWKRRSSDKSPGESESSESVSSPSEKESDGQEVFKGSPSHSAQSPEAASRAEPCAVDVDEIVRNLTDKLSAALVNVSAKEDLVKQHAKVAEEAVVGWEKAENELALLKEQLDATSQQKSTLEDRVSHLDGALKECVRQLRQAREEQEHKINEAIEKARHEWESKKCELENKIHELQSKAEASHNASPAHIDHDLYYKLEFLENENSALKVELEQQLEELEIRTIERDLSTQAAETASKQHLEIIKKVAKLEAECRRLKSVASKSLSASDNKSAAASSIYVESLTDSQSDSGERLNMVEMDMCKVGNLETNKAELACSDTWASALIAELNQFKNEKTVKKASIEIDLMDDFLEMERLAALPDDARESSHHESQDVKDLNSTVRSLKAEHDEMINRTVELEDKLRRLEQEKAELQMALTKSQDSIEASQGQLKEALNKLEELERELALANDVKESLESQLSFLEAEARTMYMKVESLEEEVKTEKALSVDLGNKCCNLEEELMSRTQGMYAKVESLEEEIKNEKALSAEKELKCRNLEDELASKIQELDFQQSASSNSQAKIKQEDLAVAAGRLADCQKTIVSLRKQLESLATLEDFLIDTASIPGFSAGGSMLPQANGELWKFHSNDTFSPKRDSNCLKTSGEKLSPPLVQTDNGKSPASSSSSSSAVSSQVSSEKNRNGFAKFFSRTKNGIQLEI